MSDEARPYRRKVASPKQWQAIIAAKLGPCRVCTKTATNGGIRAEPHPIEFHHLIPRAQGGDDVADNIIPLHESCHFCVTVRQASALQAVAESLTDAEDAYVIGKLGGGGS